MISMDFLSKRVAGNEFIDFQSDDFYQKLKACLSSHITYEGSKARLSKDCEVEVLQLIREYVGFKNITIKFMELGNLYIDAGYMAPGHVLNNAGVDALLKPTQTTLYRWFEQNHLKIFKGGVDYKTGKVFGSFCDIPLEMGINRNITDYFNMEKVAKWGADIPGALAGGLTHELGHAWSACMMLLTTVKDNLVARTALEHYRNVKRPEDRVVVLKDAATLLDIKPADLDELKAFATNERDEQFILYFTKLKAQRDSQRALSVGVTQMTSEVVADMYAIRMGCHKGIIAGVASMVDKGTIRVAMESVLFAVLIACNSLWFSVLFASIAGSSIASIFVLAGAIGAVAGILGYFARGYSDVYNSDHRRLEDAMRQLVAKLKESKNLPGKEQAELVQMISMLVDKVKELKPWYDNTGFYRSLGWMFSGSDFKRQEIEHHTQTLNNHELTALGHQLKALT